ncbi:hypothetical protein CUC43_14865 [Bacillus thuringiensis LM1212]|uniref:GTPase n=1 Tax=Bacillus cereus group TaxID=86661 RepID=UPI000419B8B4|nr:MULTISPECIES: GTPase [Bacillus cereus group]AXY08024.1 hypothetical protein CUC43_14865 [Bacillus thuringiensis LM1212]QDF26332.1 hypothetical protein FJR70_26785 [Bacillus tropicus]QUG94271.1 hypothetical protein HCM98_04685 [Bacillus tropicus]
MNLEIVNIINEFQTNVELAGEKLNQFSKRIHQKDQNIHTIIQDFHHFFSDIEINEKNNEFIGQLHEALQQYKERSETWLQVVKSHIDGQEFINQFEKSVLFVVFGNVNVGKSSIGNFIAGSTKEVSDYYKQIPPFFVYDFAGGVNSKEPVQLPNNRFKENATEETTTIQYYTLNEGLTWVDSPGIHSINGENEDLAKRYVEYADLVLFVMSSSSPAKYDEFVEMSRLMNKQKPMLVVINKSDVLEYDEVDGEIVQALVAKTKKDREKQEGYVKELFVKNPSIDYMQGVESISISTHLARKALVENDLDLFIDSGIPAFYKKLGSLVKEEALLLKQKSPRQRVNSIIEDIIYGVKSESNNMDGIQQMKSAFQSISNNISQKIEEVNNLQNKLVREVHLNSIRAIDMEISKMSMALQREESIESGGENIIQVITDNFNETLKKSVSQLLKDFTYENMKTLNINLNVNLEARYEEYSYKEYSVKEYNRDPKGIVEHIGAFFGAEYKDIKIVNNTVERKVAVGDNAKEVIDSIFSILEKELQPIVTKTLSNISENYFKKEKEIVASIIEKLNEVEIKLKNEMM